MRFAEKFQKIIENHPAVFLFLIANIIVMLCVFIIFVAIIIDFAEYHKTQKVHKAVRSLVDTGSMFVFFIIYYAIIRFGWGRLIFESLYVNYILIITGIFLLVIGTIINVHGRFLLKNNWANQVTVYKNQILIKQGVYKYIRHPLYASIIWMMIGRTLIYSNYLALICIVLIFIPMMVYRAKQEEKLLSSEFPEYLDYKKKVGMFIPKKDFHGTI
jgi:protein-S-isoprenylcysteine O-methyltransferase Ste14